MDPGFRAELLGFARARLARSRRLRQLCRDERPRAFRDRHGCAMTYLVHRDTYPENLGGWRVTRLGSEAGQLVPWGHNVARSYRGALEEAHANGADLDAEEAIS
jgi:hypothetical protein